MQVQGHGISKLGVLVVGGIGKVFMEEVSLEMASDRWI